MDFPPVQHPGAPSTSRRAPSTTLHRRVSERPPGQAIDTAWFIGIPLLDDHNPQYIC